MAAAAVSDWAKGIALTSAKVLRGAPVARRVRLEVETAAQSFVAETGSSPTLATVLAGNAPPSSAYRDAISQAMGTCGITHVDVLLPVAATTGRIVEAVERLNERDDVHGIIVLLPLPPHVHVLDVVSSIAPDQGRRRHLADQRWAASSRTADALPQHSVSRAWRSSTTTRFRSPASERWSSGAEMWSGSRWPRC